jgi:anti-sigma-K factor RskA
MNDDNKPAENVTAAADTTANDSSTARWRLVLLVLCAVGAGLVIGILAMQITEYLFYQAPPDVWP